MDRVTRFTAVNAGVPASLVQEVNRELIKLYEKLGLNELRIDKIDTINLERQLISTITYSFIPAKKKLDILPNS